MITPTMHYTKIAGGRLDRDLQNRFLEAQTLSEHHGVAATIIIEITVAPKLNEEHGAIQYKSNIKTAAKKSKAFSTQINSEGFIAFDSGHDFGEGSAHKPLPEVSPRQSSFLEETDGPTSNDPNNVKFGGEK